MRYKPFEIDICTENKIIINFNDIISELQNKNLKLCFIQNRGLFIEDNKNNLYQMETYKISSYLNQLIQGGIVVEFYRINQSDSDIIEDLEKEIWGIHEVNNFIEKCI